MGDEHYYAQELFENEELTGYLRNTLDAKRATHERVVYGSQVERSFAQSLEDNEAIKVYAKLPNWFKIQTPPGTYNPDWAVLVSVDGTERLYFVVETKSSLFDDDIRERESAKIECGKAHFEALKSGDNPAQFIKATKAGELLAAASKASS